jgi:hypothetical protein
MHVIIFVREAISDVIFVFKEAWMFCWYSFFLENSIEILGGFCFGGFRI